MISVLVVEDEPPILNNVRRNIEKAHSLFKVTATAYNGREALDILEKEDFHIDVVITDINMPVMNGLELLKVLSRDYPHITPVVLSGYEEFSYAKSAFKMGVFDYLLKPIDRLQLKEQLDSLAHHLDKERNKSVLPLLEDVLLSTGHWEELHHDLEGQPLIVILACAGPFPVSESDYLLPGRTYWEKHNLLTIAQRFFPNTSLWCLSGWYSAEKILIFQKSEKISNEDLKDFHTHLQRLDRLPVSLCFSVPQGNYELLGMVHQNLRKTLHNQQLFGKSTLCSLGEGEVKKSSFSKLKTLKEELIQELNSFNIQSIREHITYRVGQFIDKGCLQVELEQFLFFTFYSLVNVPLSDISYLRVESLIKDLMTNCYRKEAVLESLSVIFDNTLTPKSYRDRDKEALVSEIKDYLTLNYNKPINNQILSEQFGLVPSYLSTLFKSKEGLSPSDFLLKIRMEKSRELLLGQQNLLAKDVARIVGYQDPLYFSRVFKKYFRINPQMVKKKGRNKEEL